MLPIRSAVLVVVALALFPALAFSQDAPNNVHQATAAPSNARFEIAQSQLAVRWTFRLDRFTGQVFQLVRTKDEDLTWEEMRVEGRPTQASGRPRFQLFLSGIAARNMFLIDTDTGQSWVLVTTKVRKLDGTESDQTLWQRMIE